ncbi:MAG: iron ABC transporter permease [Chloroflexi bacterium]|nr:iron ABC transporter permease [Chloroflexota bacterium]
MTVGQGLARSPFRWRRGRAGPPVILWLPALAVGAAMLLPLVYLVVRGTGASEEAWDLLLRWRTMQILGRSVLLVAAVTGISVAIAVPVAWLTVRTDLPFRRVWMVLTALPLVIPSYVGAFLMVSALGPKGLLQQMLSAPFGVDRLPDIYGFPGATLTLALLSYPYVLLTVRAVLSNLDPSLEEAARGLGHSPWQAFRRVALPQLRPAIASGGLLVALYTLSDFGAVSLFDYETFTWAIYQQFNGFDRTIASVLSLVLVSLAIVLLLVESWSRGRLRYYRTGAGTRRRSREFALGRWKWPALGFCGGVVLLALVLPMSVLGYWVIRAVGSGEPLLLSWSSVWNSVYVSGLAAIAAAVASVPVAALVVRYPGLLSKTIERASFVGYALPGVVVALALVFFGVRYAGPIYQTVWLLVFAYVVLFFPAALVAARSALLQVSPSLEEAARGLGRSPSGVLMVINLPLMRSGLQMAVALVFLVTMKELPATLILGPRDFGTLATSVWSASSEAFFGQAAVSALVLVLMSSVPMAFLVLREGRSGPATTGRLSP